MKIMVLSSHTPSLFWFRMEMMKEFINNGHKVIAVGDGEEDEWRGRFEEHNIAYKQLYVKRNGLNPFNDLITLFGINKLMKSEEPDKIFTYQAKTVVYGSLAAKLNGINEVYPLIAGLGSIFRGSGFKNKLLKKIMKIEYKLACYCSKKVFFQNNDDKNEFLRNGLIKNHKTVLINGSGVDLETFQKTPLPENPAFLFIGRLIKDKGIVEYLEACGKVKKLYTNVRCLLVGPFDSNPSALKPEELEPYIERGVIEYYGEQDDVRPFISQCSTFVLPSYHEGIPKTVLEAMSMGRPILTSNAPGCKETVIQGVNGLLSEVKDTQGLFLNMDFLINNPEIRSKMGAESSRIAEEKFDVKIINQSILETMGLIQQRGNYNGFV